jgi:probable F420-dependent oxidoreductase
MTDLRWGLTVPFTGVPLSGHADLYRRAEAAGYDDLWSGEPANDSDGFTPLVIAAEATERMRLVTGIVNPFTRGPGLLAQSAGALQEASGGRFVLGIGASSDVIVERFNGMEFAKPLSKVRETVEALRPVLDGSGGRGFGGLKLARPVTEPIPIVVAALRGKMLRLAAEIGDGAFTNFLPISGLPRIVEELRAGEREAGKAEASVELACRFFLFPGPEDDAMGLAKFLFANYGSVGVYSEFFRWLGWGEQLDPMVEAYTAGDRAKATELAPEELIREIFVFGEPEAMRARLEEFTGGGIDTAVLTIAAAPDQLPGLIDALAP